MFDSEQHKHALIQQVYKLHKMKYGTLCTLCPTGHTNMKMRPETSLTTNYAIISAQFSVAVTSLGDHKSFIELVAYQKGFIPLLVHIGRSSSI